MQFPKDSRHISLGERAPILNGCFQLLVCHRLMLLKLPADVEQAKQAAAYMRAEPGITVEEVTGE